MCAHCTCLCSHSMSWPTPLCLGATKGSSTQHSNCNVIAQRPTGLREVHSYWYIQTNMPIPSEQIWKCNPENAEPVDDCLRAACLGLHFDSAELWRKDSNYKGCTKFTFLRQYSAVPLRDGLEEMPLESAGSSASRTKATHGLCKLVSGEGGAMGYV